jgi:hypothetical protein
MDGQRFRSGLMAYDVPHNNGMHPTRDTHHFIYTQRAGGRVMPGVMRLQSHE